MGQDWVRWGSGLFDPDAHQKEFGALYGLHDFLKRKEARSSKRRKRGR